jgi:hypothetical protein
MNLLTNLEPRFEARHTIIIDELDEFNEIVFVSQGSVVIGYEVNKQKRYCIKYRNNCIIGPFGITFNQRSQFIYTTLTEIHGFFIRKSNWKLILDLNP